MKLKSGEKLHRIREERKMTQEEFAELLGLTPATYGRIERNQSQVDVEQLQRFSKALEVPFTELLPDTLTINHHNNHQGVGGCIFGNLNYFASPGEQPAVNEIMHENERLKDKLAFLEEKIALLEQLVKAKG